MKKHDDKNTKTIQILISIVIILSGLIFLLAVNYIKSASTQRFIEALGTSLICGGFVNCLFVIFHIKEFNSDKFDKLKMRILAVQREKIDRNYHNEKYNSAKIEILGKTLYDCLKDLLHDKKIITQVLEKGAKANLMFVNPLAPYVTKRALQKDKRDSEDLKKRLLASVFQSIVLYYEFNNYFINCRNKKDRGSFEIRLIDVSTSVTINKYDEHVFWGPYTYGSNGGENPLFKLTDDSNLRPFKQLLVSHFTTLWSMNKNNWLVRYNAPHTPKLNYNLISEIINEGYDENDSKLWNLLASYMDDNYYKRLLTEIDINTKKKNNSFS